MEVTNDFLKIIPPPLWLFFWDQLPTFFDHIFQLFTKINHFDDGYGLYCVVREHHIRMFHDFSEEITYMRRIEIYVTQFTQDRVGLANQPLEISIPKLTLEPDSFVGRYLLECWIQAYFQGMFTKQPCTEGMNRPDKDLIDIIECRN